MTYNNLSIWFFHFIYEILLINNYVSFAAKKKRALSTSSNSNSGESLQKTKRGKYHSQYFCFPISLRNFCKSTIVYLLQRKNRVNRATKTVKQACKRNKKVNTQLIIIMAAINALSPKSNCKGSCKFLMVHF